MHTKMATMVLGGTIHGSAIPCGPKAACGGGGRLFSIFFPFISPVFILPCFSFIFSDCILESDLSLTKSWLIGRGGGGGMPKLTGPISEGRGLPSRQLSSDGSLSS